MSHSRDVRPRVPEGWQAAYDNDYQTWYYINLATQQSQWDEPLGTVWPRSPPPVPRPSAPPRQRDITPVYQQDHIQLPPVVQQTVYQQPVIQQPPPMPVPAYPQQQQQPTVVVEQPQHRHHNSGMSKGLLGAGMGFLGGALLAETIDHHHGYGGYGGYGGGGYGGGYGNDTIIENNYYDDDNNNYGDDFNNDDFSNDNNDNW